MSFPRMLPFKFSTGDNRPKPLRNNARVTVSRLLTEPCSVHYANLKVFIVVLTLSKGRCKIH
jgi:hypothetical protein